MDKDDIVKQDNPAGRLWHLLSKARANEGSTMAYEVWGDVLGVDHEERAELLRQMGHLVQLVRETEYAMKCASPVYELYENPFDNILSCLFQDLDTRWHNTREYLNDKTMMALAFGAELLSGKSSESNLEEEELRELESEITDLIEQVLSGKLTEELKKLIVEQLEGLRSSILHYRIFGIEGMKKALERAIGAVILQYDLYKKAEGTEEIGKFDSVLRKVGRIVNLGSKMKTLAAPIARLFLPEEVDAGE